MAETTTTMRKNPRISMNTVHFILKFSSNADCEEAAKMVRDRKIVNQNEIVKTLQVNEDTLSLTFKSGINCTIVKQFFYPNCEMVACASRLRDIPIPLYTKDKPFLVGMFGNTASERAKSEYQILMKATEELKAQKRFNLKLCIRICIYTYEDAYSGS
jgi:hypothetical protein